MKLSVSLPREDVEFLDAYADQRGIDSRSAALHRAVRVLRTVELSLDYEQAWDEWTASGEEDVWREAAADGLAQP